MVSILLPSVVIPLIAVVVMTIMEAAVRPSPLSEKMCDIGWDLCILGVGVTGGIFAHSEMKEIYKDNLLIWAILVILINIGLASVILLIRRHYNPAIRQDAGPGAVPPFLVSSPWRYRAA